MNIVELLIDHGAGVDQNVRRMSLRKLQLQPEMSKSRCHLFFTDYFVVFLRLTVIFKVRTNYILVSNGHSQNTNKNHSCIVCTISFERPVNYLCDAWHVFPPQYEAWTYFNN